MNKCLFCKSKTENPKFCNKSCSARYNNPIHHVGPKKKRKCRDCGTEDLLKFNKHASLCMKCKSRKYNSKDRRLKLKQKCVDFKGGSCICCGYNKCLSALEFHHQDSKEKENAISTLIRLYSSFEKLKPELEKCDLVCANCHREIHESHKGIQNRRSAGHEVES